MEQNRKESTPRIYVASLSDYNAGTLHGCWIDASQDAQTIHAAIAAMLAESREPIAEEWAIHDYESFGGLSLGEYESIESVAEVAALLAEHGGFFGQLVEHFGGLANLEDAKRCMDDGGYCGAFKSLEDYVYDFIEDCYGDAINGLPDFIRGHLDYEGMARDLEISGDVFTIEYEGEVHVFNGNC
jgi:antirestriction protein